MRTDCRTHDIHRVIRCKTNKNVSIQHSTPLTSWSINHLDARMLPTDLPTRTKFCLDCCSRALGTPYSITIIFHMEWAHLPLLNYFTSAHLVFVHWNYGLAYCCMPAASQVSMNLFHKILQEWLWQFLSFRSRLRSSWESRANNFDWSSDLYDAIGYHVLARRGAAVFAKGMQWSKSIDVLESFISIFWILQNNSKLLRVTCAIASLLFVVSDSMIAIDKYYAPINNSTVCFDCPHNPPAPLNIYNLFFLVALDHDHVLCGTIRHHIEHRWFARNKAKRSVDKTVDKSSQKCINKNLEWIPF